MNGRKQNLEGSISFQSKRGRELRDHPGETYEAWMCNNAQNMERRRIRSEKVRNLFEVRFKKKINSELQISQAI